MEKALLNFFFFIPYSEAETILNDTKNFLGRLFHF